MRDEGKDDTTSSGLPDSYVIGDRLNWNAPWVDVNLWAELPFWLMVNNSTMSVECGGHTFLITITDGYFELFFGEATDSRGSVGYRGPYKKREELSEAVRNAMDQHPNGPYMWRKCKTVLKVESRCNEDVWNAAMGEPSPRKGEAKAYLVELCRAHIPVINRLVQSYRLATYDYHAYEVSPWDVSLWTVERSGNAVSSNIVSYRAFDSKPIIFDLNQKPNVYKLIGADELRKQMSPLPTPGELELLDALNLMERGDYSGAVRRVTTAIEVIVEHVSGKAVEAAKGQQAAAKFLKDTRTRFDSRLKMYQTLTGRNMIPNLAKHLQETRTLRHRIVHTGYRIGPDERGRAQKAVDTGRWIFNWFENDQTRRDIREKRAKWVPGRDLAAGIFQSKITSDGVVLSSIREQIKMSKTP
jgi:hypothetical protein